MSLPAEERVVVTGWSCLTALGANTETSWSRLLNQEYARGPISCFPTDGCRVTEGAEVVLPELPWLPKKAESRLSRASRLALPAAREALQHAGLLDPAGRSKLGHLEMSLSTTATSMERIEAFVRQVWEGKSPIQQAGRVASYQAQQQVNDLQTFLGFSGPAAVVSNACAGGANSIGHAFDLIRAGLVDIVLTGGYDILCELVFCGFDSLQAMSPDRCRPFDVNRNGLMLGEGAAFLVLESESHARRRGVPILGVLAGYGHTTDTFHLTQPAPDGTPLEKAIRKALEQSATSPSELGYINAHGTGTPFNDRAEAQAFTRCLGANASGVRLSSTKAAIGHTLGAAGSIEAVLCLKTLQTGQIPPQLHTTDPEPLVANMLARPGALLEKNAALSVNLGFGGSNAALLFKTP